MVAATGVILAALYLLWAYQRTFHGPVTDDNAGFREMRWSEGLIIAPLLALIVFLGVYPTPLLERMEPSVRALVEHVDDEVDDFEAVEVEYVGASDVPEPGHEGDEEHGSSEASDGEEHG